MADWPGSIETFNLRHNDLQERLDDLLVRFATEHKLSKGKAILIARRGLERLRHKHQDP